MGEELLPSAVGFVRPQHPHVARQRGRLLLLSPRPHSASHVQALYFQSQGHCTVVCVLVPLFWMSGLNKAVGARWVSQQCVHILLVVVSAWPPPFQHALHRGRFHCWVSSTSVTCVLHCVQDHTDEVTAATVHASGDYFVTASLDRTWALYDVQSGLCITQVPAAWQSTPRRK